MGDELWIRERLELLITQKIEETYQLDYKSAGSLASSEGKKDDITKNVASFANSNGGTIIYGIKEFDEKDKKHLPERIDPVDGRAFTHEWLDQIIGQIDPRIEGVRIIPVRVGTEEWHTCYVVEIPKGETAHQAM
jgi:predicted HTH transcriptional regulator